VVGFFFDASAVVKRYVNETGTAWVNGILHPQARNSIHLSRIMGVEVVSAITRRARCGSITIAAAAVALAQFRHEYANNFHLVAVTPRLIVRAMTLPQVHGLRGYDAVQLAAALRVNAQRRARNIAAVTLISADTALLAAAAAEGLAVDDPNAHP
jgi:predicted nucleic acid-binding protein